MSKKGFQIEIQTGLSRKEQKVAEEYALKWISEVAGNDLSWKKSSRGGWHSFYKRGAVGHRIDRDFDLFFRRCSRGKRIFHIVRLEEIHVKENYEEMKMTGDKKISKTHTSASGQEYELGKGCQCGRCSAVAKTITKDVETTVYCTIGAISG